MQLILVSVLVCVTGTSEYVLGDLLMEKANDIKLGKENVLETIKQINIKLSKQELDIADLKHENEELKNIVNRQNTEIRNLKVQLEKQSKDIENFAQRAKTDDSEVTGSQDNNNQVGSDGYEEANMPDKENGKIQNVSNLKASNNERPALSLRGRQISQKGPVAFSAYLDHNVEHAGEGQTIKFNQILINDGNGYNRYTGVFTAPESGVYFFTFTIHNQQHQTNARLVKDSQNIVGSVVDTKETTENNMSTNSAVITVEAGQAVWVEQLTSNAELISVSNYRQVTFSGFLLY